MEFCQIAFQPPHPQANGCFVGTIFAENWYFFLNSGFDFRNWYFDNDYGQTFVWTSLVLRRGFPWKWLKISAVLKASLMPLLARVTQRSIHTYTYSTVVLHPSMTCYFIQISRLLELQIWIKWWSWYIWILYAVWCKHKYLANWWESKWIWQIWQMPRGRSKFSKV